MRSLRHVFLLGALLTLAAAASADVEVLKLCEWREEDGLQCECKDNEANCEVTRPLVAFGHRSHHTPPAEAAKRRRDARTINTLVLQSPRNESFLGKFPADIFEEPLQFKSIQMAYASLGELASYTISGSRYLRELTLSACGINGLLKNAISGLENLRRIDLSHNKIAHIGVGAMKNLPALKELIIAHSGVEVIEPYAFVELRSLEKLSLRDNDLREVNRSLFTGLQKLQELKLNYNYLQKLDENTFQGMTNLRHVDLSGNRLTVLKADTFRGLRDLAYLSLFYNTLRTLPKAFLKDSPNLTELNLERNRLEMVDLSTLRGLRPIRSTMVLHLKDNPLNCSCDLYYLRELRKRRMASLDSDLEDPPEFENLQCRERMTEHLEPRVLDDFFIKNNCQHDPTLSEHIQEEVPVAGAHTLALHSKSVLLVCHALLAVASYSIVQRLL